MLNVVIFGFVASIFFIGNGIDTEATIEDDVCKDSRLKQELEMLRISLRTASLSLKRAEQQLKKTCKHRPVVINLIGRLNLSSSSLLTGYYAFGVTKHKDRIYVFCGAPTSILVFEDRNPFRLLDEVNLTRIDFPSDIIYNDRSKRFYVTDPITPCIWKIMIKNGDQANVIKWLNGTSFARTMSLSSDGQLLVLVDGHYLNSTQSYLEIYNGSDDRLIRRLQLPSEIKQPEHVIQTKTGEFLISHKMEDKYNGMWIISRVTSDGQRIIGQPNPRNGLEEIVWRCHFSLDADNNRLFVADHVNNRVVLLDSISLEFRQILLTNERDGIQRPTRAYFDKFNKQLIVVKDYYDHNNLRGVVDVYEIN